MTAPVTPGNGKGMGWGVPLAVAAVAAVMVVGTVGAIAWKHGASLRALGGAWLGDSTTHEASQTPGPPEGNDRPEKAKQKPKAKRHVKKTRPHAEAGAKGVDAIGNQEDAVGDTAEPGLAPPPDMRSQIEAYRAATSDFARLTLVDRWVRKGDLAALPVLLEVGPVGNPALRGSILGALGTLGRETSDPRLKERCRVVLSAFVATGAAGATQMESSEGLLAVEALIALGLPGSGEAVSSALEVPALDPLLAERIVVLIEATGAPSKDRAAARLLERVETGEGPGFAALPPEEKERMSRIARSMLE